MTNDTTTLNGALSELGETMADNLVAMGVLDASANDGLTTLAGKILCIEPSIGGLDLDTAVTLSASSASIVRGQSVVLTSKLTATYDDETLVNVDLSGVLTGATILFKEGNTTLGSGVTDSNGIATATIYDLAVGSHTIKAVFAGTDNFNDCESSSVSVTVTAPAVDSITLVKSAGKDILSYADVSSGTEFCTLTATVLDDNDDPIPGETVVLKKNNVTWDTLTTDSNGQVSKTYTSSGVGDLEFVAQCGSILSETYEILDLSYYDPSSSSNLSKYTVPSDATMSYDSTNSCYSFVKTRRQSTTTILLDNITFSNRCRVKADICLASGENIQARLGLWNGNNGITSRAIATVGGNTTYFGISSQTKGDDGTNLALDQNIGITTGVWYTLEVTYETGSVTARLLNGSTVVDTLTASESTLGVTGNNFGIDVGYTINNTVRIKNIQIQEL